jgi:hypothetical protein
MKINKLYLFSTIFALIYFFLALLTLNSYGQNWDEIIHYRRAQSYLHFFFTGKTDYSNLPTYNLQGTNGDPSKVPIPRRSIYQNDYHNMIRILALDGAHGPVSDELADLVTTFSAKTWDNMILTPSSFYNICLSILVF